MNKGDVPTPIKVTFCGESINPKITNLTTGEFIKVNRSILLNYSLVINTEFGNKEVKIVAPDGVEQNAFSYIDLESSFFMLNVGENRFSFITDGGQPEVYIEYRNKYLGV
ncbi:phage distal tail protein [Metabacillus fastidiosus]|uniref:phage distal tail protein n=1 Tax=Metabacillus fastidiosus TaxID=1458 RepID=UPI003D2BC3A9